MNEQPAVGSNCLNCSTPLQGEYCHQCGQHHRLYIRSIFAVLGDLMGEIGHWDSRFYRTLRGLFLRPGFLSLEFMRGRHASYVPPLRLYFFISLVAFVVFSSFIDFELNPQQLNSDATAEVNLPDEIRFDLPFLSPEQRLLLEQKVKYLVDNPNILMQRMVQLTPQMMLLMLPFWALFLKLIYLLRRHYYLEHLTLALHTHAFLLLSLMLMTLSSQLFSGLASVFQYTAINQLGDWVDTGLLLWITLYMLLTQKYFYGQSWPMTLFKFLLCAVIYSVLLSSAFVVTLVYGIITA